MLSSNSSSCNHNPNYTLFSENDITSLSFTSESENPNFLFGLIPNSPHLDDYLHFLDHAYLNTPPPEYYSIAAAAVVPNENTAGNHSSHRPAAAKKNRHTKINTARGPRDRRMRLSLDIARRFFDLQDRLGFDKASRTVEWLLHSSSSAIRALARGRSGSLSESCTSEDYCCEAVSSSGAEVGKSRVRGKRGKSRGGVQQKRATVARESRRKARERARERTSQKRRLMMRESGDGGVPMYGAAVGVVENLSSDEARVLCPWNSFLFDETDHAAFFHQDEQIEEFDFNGIPRRCTPHSSKR